MNLLSSTKWKRRHLKGFLTLHKITTEKWTKFELYLLQIVDLVLHTFAYSKVFFIIKQIYVRGHLHHRALEVRVELFPISRENVVEIQTWKKLIWKFGGQNWPSKTTIPFYTGFTKGLSSGGVPYLILKKDMRHQYHQFWYWISSTYTSGLYLNHL